MQQKVWKGHLVFIDFMLNHYRFFFIHPFHSYLLFSYVGLNTHCNNLPKYIMVPASFNVIVCSALDYV